jgi:hypothetical protein
MDNIEKCFTLIQQSSTKGISAIEIAKQLDKHRTTIHSYLNHLYYTGRAESRNGLWYPKTGQQAIKPLEKEIVIKLPLPEKEWRRMVLLEDAANTFGGRRSDNIFQISLDKLEETRTIRIIGKNVDDLELTKVSELVKEAHAKTKFSLNKFFKGFKKPSNKEKIVTS